MAKEEAKDILYRDEKMKKEKNEYRNSLLNELKDDLTPAQILYSSTDKLENIKNELAFKNKQKANGNIINYDYIENDKTLSKQEKIEKLKERKQQVDKEITRQGNIEKGKIIGLGALEIGAMALPQGRVMKAGAKVGEAVLRKHVGKAIGKAVGEGVASGVVTGSVGGAIDAAKKKENVLKGAAGGAVAGGAVGAVGSAVGANIEKVVKAKVLENAPDMRLESPEAKKKFRDRAKEYYQDYLQFTDVNHEKVGKIDFTKKGVKKTLNKNINAGKTLPKLKKNMKKAVDVTDTVEKDKNGELYKPRGDNTETFLYLQNGDEIYNIAKSNQGQKYYLTKKAKDENLNFTSTQNNNNLNVFQRAKKVLYNKFRKK